MSVEEKMKNLLKYAEEVIEESKEKKIPLNAEFLKFYRELCILSEEDEATKENSWTKAVDSALPGRTERPEISELKVKFLLDAADEDGFALRSEVLGMSPIDAYSFLKLHSPHTINPFG